MGSYGETVSVPVQGTPAPSGDMQKKLDAGFAAIREKGADMISVKPVAERDFEPLTANLKEIGSELDLQIKKYSAELGNIKKIEDFNPRELNRCTTGLVIKYPARALEAQGNINYEMAGKLTAS